METGMICSTTKDYGLYFLKLWQYSQSSWARSEMIALSAFETGFLDISGRYDT